MIIQLKEQYILIWSKHGLSGYDLLHTDLLFNHPLYEKNGGSLFIWKDVKCVQGCSYVTGTFQGCKGQSYKMLHP